MLFKPANLHKKLLYLVIHEKKCRISFQKQQVFADIVNFTNGAYMFISWRILILTTVN